MNLNKRNPWIAALLSVFCAGLGHVYCGRYARGILIFGGLALLSFAPAFVLLWTGGAGLLLLGLGIGLAMIIRIAVVFDAWELAPKNRQPLNSRDWILLAIAFIFAAAIGHLAAFVAPMRAFKITAASMRPALQQGDHVWAARSMFLRDAMKRGDIGVFRFPDDGRTAIHCGGRQYGKDFIQRVIGLPGDRIEVRSGRVILNGLPLGEEGPYAVHDTQDLEPLSPQAKNLAPERYQQLWQERHLDSELQNNQRDFFGPVTVPPHSYFMMGDSRDHSCDSRYWGPVPMASVFGPAVAVYWPPNRARSLR